MGFLQDLQTGFFAIAFFLFETVNFATLLLSDPNLSLISIPSFPIINFK